MGQEVASGQFVQTWRQRTESKRLDKLSQTQKERRLCLEKYGDFTGNNETEDLVGRLLWLRWAQLLFLMIILGAVTKNVIMPKNESQKNVARTETASGTLSEPSQHPEEVLR